jgi:hypothetical protein
VAGAGGRRGSLPHHTSCLPWPVAAARVDRQRRVQGLIEVETEDEDVGVARPNEIWGQGWVYSVHGRAKLV